MKRTIKLAAIIVASSMVIARNPSSIKAATITGEEPVAGINVYMDEYYTAASASMDQIKTQPVSRDSIKGFDSLQYQNLAVANVSNHLNIRKYPGEDKEIIGKLPKDAGCTILEEAKDGWVKIRSGKVTGYVAKEYLLTGEKAKQKALQVGYQTATVNTQTLYVREKPNTDCTILTLVPEGEELEVLERDEHSGWVKIMLDNEEGYVSAEYVDMAFQLKKAVFTQDLMVNTSAGITSVRAGMVAYAKQFLGHPYVYGGNSLTNGIDCSGFTKAIYSHFGYTLNRTSSTQPYNGTAISLSHVKPGDLVFYSSGGRISHVAMYIGNGQIIHASNPRDGIKISSMYYKTPTKAVRIIPE